MHTRTYVCSCESCQGTGCTCGCQAATALARTTRPTAPAGPATTATAVLLAVSTALVALAPTPAAAQASVCGTATLLDVEVVMSRIPQPTITFVQTRRKGHGKSGDRAVQVYTTPSERQNKTYVVTVRLNDFTYVAQSPGSDFWNFNPTRLVVNDAIDACVSNGHLRLRRPDGKDYKTTIVRVERSAALP